MARMLGLLAWVVGAAAAEPNVTNASETCDIIVRIGYPEGLAPYAVAAPTRWLDGDGACFAFYRHQSGQRALEKIQGGDLDMAIFGTSVFAEAVERGAGITFVSVWIKILRRVRAESSRRPPRHRRDACSMAWRCRFLAARRSQHGRVISAPDSLV